MSNKIKIFICATEQSGDNIGKEIISEVLKVNKNVVFEGVGGSKMSTMLNEHTSLPAWAHHVVAHELHHSIQLRYGYSTSGTPGNYIHNMWFFEQSATYMENVIFPNSTHLRTMLSNCNVVTPLTFPEHSIGYPYEIYPYRSALWQKLYFSLKRILFRIWCFSYYIGFYLLGERILQKMWVY